MKILEKAKTPNRIIIQLEDWGEDYPTIYNNSYKLCIGCYPVAKKSSKYKFVVAGETFRLSIFSNVYRNYCDDYLKKDFELLKNGAKIIEDLAEYFYNGKKDMYYLGIYDGKQNEEDI